MRSHVRRAVAFSFKYGRARYRRRPLSPNKRRTGETRNRRPEEDVGVLPYENLAPGYEYDLQAERLTRELLETLAYLHELSPPVVHRDVTPANVMIDQGGRAMLVDFGAVRSLSHQPGQAQTVLGTPGYMAPEQAMGEDLGQRLLGRSGAKPSTRGYTQASPRRT